MLLVGCFGVFLPAWACPSMLCCMVALCRIRYHFLGCSQRARFCCVVFVCCVVGRLRLVVLAFSCCGTFFGIVALCLWSRQFLGCSKARQLGFFSGFLLVGALRDLGTRLGRHCQLITHEATWLHFVLGPVISFGAPQDPNTSFFEFFLEEQA